MNRIRQPTVIEPEAGMTTNPVLLCIHRDPTRLRVLQENGYELLTAANGHEGLGVFGAQAVDAVVLEYNLGPLGWLSHRV